jgi:hypothetical protein
MAAAASSESGNSAAATEAGFQNAGNVTINAKAAVQSILLNTTRILLPASVSAAARLFGAVSESYRVAAVAV